MLARRVHVVLGALVAGLMLVLATSSRADTLDDQLQTVWESLWDQSGTPRQLSRWDQPIRYRIHGTDFSRHADHIRAAIHAVSTAANVAFIDVSAQADAATAAMLDLEVVKDNALRENDACLTHYVPGPNWGYQKIYVKMRPGHVWRCAFHEMMHVMGVPGHPSGKTVLSYFPYRVDVLMDLDKLMLAAWYSPQMQAGATPVEALQVLGNAVMTQPGLGVSPELARARTDAFVRSRFEQMQSLANGQGEIPAILLRSGRSGGALPASAQNAALYFVGLDYLRGVIVGKNLPASSDAFRRAALRGHKPAQLMWARALRSGTGVQADPVAAHAWLVLAAGGGNPAARQELVSLESELDEDQLARARSLPAPKLDTP